MSPSERQPGRITDLDRLEVEQLLPMPGGASVAVRCVAAGATLVGRFTIEEARAIANEILAVAARVEYEADFDQAATAQGYSFEAVTEIIGLIRSGQERRRSVAGEVAQSFHRSADEGPMSYIVKVLVGGKIDLSPCDSSRGGAVVVSRRSDVPNRTEFKVFKRESTNWIGSGEGTLVGQGVKGSPFEDLELGTTVSWDEIKREP